MCTQDPIEHKNIQRWGTLEGFTSYIKKQKTKPKNTGMICKGIQLRAEQGALSGYSPWGQYEVVICADLLRKGMIVCLLEKARGGKRS